MDTHCSGYQILIMADSTQNSSSVANSTNSTIYKLNGSAHERLTRMEDSVNSVSSAASSMGTDSLTVEDFNGFTSGDLNTDNHLSDPFQGIFYHLMHLQDTTTVLFYNRPIFNNILTVLSKQYKFPSEETKKFQLKTYVDKNKCILKIDRTMMSVCASGPGHTLWKDKCFKKLAESIYRTFIDETNTQLNTNRVSETLPTIQDTTQNSEDNELIINDTLEEPEAQLPTGPEIQQPEQVAFTHLQDSLVIRKITILMDMISTMRGEMSKLTKEVNYLAQKLAANQSIYRTVDQTNASSTSLNQSAHNELLQGVAAQEEVQVNTETRPPVTSDSNLPSPALELPDLQTKQYSDVLRTSTPRDITNGTPHRPCPTPRRTIQPQVLRPSPRPAPRAVHNNDSNQILLIGDSLISSVNPKGLTSNVVKNGISGGNIDKVSTQIKVYDIRKFSHVIVYVGGNDASNGTDIEYFEEMFDQVIQHIKGANHQCKIILCTSCPRSDTSTSDVNDIIQTLAQHHNISFINQNKAFHDRHGHIIAGYYDTDGIHLSPSGVKRLLGTINREVTIVDDFAKCAYGRHRGTTRRQQTRKQQQQHHQMQQSQGRRNRNTQDRQINVNHRQQESVSLCYKCGESNHDTNSCKHKKQLECFHCGYLGHKSGRCLQKVNV